jgi:hypothetical protein
MLLGHEELAGDRGHRREYPLVADPAPAKLALDHPRALTLELGHTGVLPGSRAQKM